MAGLGKESQLQLSRHVKLKVDTNRDECFLLAPEKAVKLTGSASRILEHLQSTKSLHSLNQSLQSEFGDSFVEEELVEFLEAMISNGWVTVVAYDK